MKLRNSRLIIIFSILFLIILSAMLYFTFMANSSADGVMTKPVLKQTVIIDAGHGGDDGLSLIHI